MGRELCFDAILTNLMKKGQRHNVILTAPPGTGKTHLAKYVADRIKKKEVHEYFHGYKVYYTTASQIIEGASLLGEKERKINALFCFLEQQGGKTLLFIDEIHQLISAGTNRDDTMNTLANLMLTWIQKPTIKIIGATTFFEVKLKSLNSAFASRCYFVRIPPLSKE